MNIVWYDSHLNLSGSAQSDGLPSCPEKVYKVFVKELWEELQYHFN